MVSTGDKSNSPESNSPESNSPESNSPESTNSPESNSPESTDFLRHFRDNFYRYNLYSVGKKYVSTSWAHFFSETLR